MAYPDDCRGRRFPRRNSTPCAKKVLYRFHNRIGLTRFESCTDREISRHLALPAGGWFSRLLNLKILHSPSLFVDARSQEFPRLSKLI